MTYTNGYKLWNDNTMKFMIARDVVVEEASILTSKAVHEKGSVAHLDNIDQDNDAESTETEEPAFSRLKHRESVITNSDVQANENSTNLENADPVKTTGDELKKNLEKK